MNTWSFLTVSGTSTGNSQWLRACRVAGIISRVPEHHFKMPHLPGCGWAWQKPACSLSQAEQGARFLVIQSVRVTMQYFHVADAITVGATLLCSQ